MLYADEAHTITLNSTAKSRLKETVEKVLPLIEQAIRDMAALGCAATLVKTETIMKEIGFVPETKREVIDAIAAKLKNYGYKTSIPNSYTSIHIEW